PGGPAADRGRRPADLAAIRLRAARPRRLGGRGPGANSRIAAVPRPPDRTSHVTPAEMVARAEALLVDLDGTLVDSTGPVRRAWDAFAARHGLDADCVHRFGQGRPSGETIRLLVPDADHEA